MNFLILLLLTLPSVSKTFTVRIFAAQRPNPVTISSEEGTYTIRASGSQLIVNGKQESYFQQIGAESYTLSAGDLLRSYVGGFTFFASGSELIILNYIPEQQYLASVVAAELPSGGAEALKAQAILARTYAYKNMGDHDAGYDLLDSQLSQVYRGLPTSQAALNAVKDTEGLILGYKGDVAQVYYHSTCGGLILLPSDVWPGAKNKPYHKRMRDTLCNLSPFYAWEDTFDLGELKIDLNLARIPTMVKLIKDSTGTPVKNWVLYAPDSILYDYNTVANALDHRPVTRRFDAEIEGDLLIIHGHGYGHGVGMCQMGAMRMAKAGANYRDILSHYFPGTEIMAVSSIR